MDLEAVDAKTSGTMSNQQRVGNGDLVGASLDVDPLRPSAARIVRLLRVTRPLMRLASGSKAMALISALTVSAALRKGNAKDVVCARDSGQG